MSQGKRAGARKGSRAPVRLRLATLGYAAAITASVALWGLLVFAAIRFGTSARAGETRDWALLAATALGAVVALFAGLMLVARLSRSLGLSSPPAPPSGRADDTEPLAEEVPHHPGGRHAG